MRMRTMGRPSTESSEERGFRTPGSGELLTQLVQMEMVIRSSGDTFRDGHPPFYEAALSIGYGFHWQTQLPGTNIKSALLQPPLPFPYTKRKRGK